MLNKLILFSFFVLIVSCSSNEIGFMPSDNMLPDATIGVDYEQKISIGTSLEENPEFLTEKNTDISIYPSDMGLHFEVNNKRRDGLSIYNFLVIKGVPLRSGEVNITISGHAYGSMYTKSSEFNKNYLLKVKQ